MGAVHSLEDGADRTSEIIVGRVDGGEPGPTVIVDPADGQNSLSAGRGGAKNAAPSDTFTPTKVEHIDPHARSMLDGVPRNNYVPGGLQIRQIPGYVFILYELEPLLSGHPDGRASAPGKDIKLWMGDSRGRWEGNTLVVDVTNFNEETWFDSHGDLPQRRLACGRTLDDGRP